MRPVSGPHAEAAGGARPASELSGDTPVKPGAWLHVFFEWRGTQRLGTGLSQERSDLEREEEVWSEGGSVCLAGPVALPAPGLPLPLHGASPLWGSVPRS